MQDNRVAVANCDPPLPLGLNDRQRNNWRVLLAIADVLGWNTEARAAAIELSRACLETEATTILLLHDLRRLFDDAPGWSLADGRPVKRLASTWIVKNLAAMEERPWPELGPHGRPITTRRLAGMLQPFGVSPKTIALADGTTAKGYDFDDLVEIFARYAHDVT